MSVLNINSGIHAGVMQAHEKCAMKMKESRKKEKENDGCVKSRLTIVSREAKKKQAVRDEQVSYLHVAPL